MRRLLLTGAICLVMPAMSAAAVARHLSVARAKAAMTMSAREDHPASITISDCRRLSRQRIRCSVAESDLAAITDNGQPVDSVLTEPAVATQLGGDRVRVTWEGMYVGSAVYAVR